MEEMAEDGLDIVDVEQVVLHGQITRTDRDDPRGTKYVIEGMAADQSTLVGVVGRYTGTGRYLNYGVCHQRRGHLMYGYPCPYCDGTVQPRLFNEKPSNTKTASCSWRISSLACAMRVLIAITRPTSSTPFTTSPQASVGLPGLRRCL
jgi:hypothetical protein